jgi:hypothetical protein
MDNLKDYRTLFKISYVSSIIILIIIPLQIIAFSIHPIPQTVPEWFNLFNNNLIIGIFNSDLFILIDNIFIAIIFIILSYIKGKQ